MLAISYHTHVRWILTSAVISEIAFYFFPLGVVSSCRKLISFHKEVLAQFAASQKFMLSCNIFFFFRVGGAVLWRPVSFVFCSADSCICVVLFDIIMP